MKCEVIQNMMSSYIDKDLNDIEKQEFEKHLSECQKCREEYQSLYEITTMCSSLEELELPSNFRTELHQKLLDEKNKNRLRGVFGRRWMKAATGVAAAVLVIAIGLGGSRLLDKGMGNSATQSVKMAPGYAGAAAPEVYKASEAYNYTVEGSDTAAAGSAGSDNYSMADAAPPALAKVSPSARNNVIVTFDDNVEGINERQFTSEAETGTAGAEAMKPAEQSSARSGRMVIRTGNISIKVASVDKSVEDISKLTESLGGYVESSFVDNITPSAVESVRGDKIIKETTSKYANMSVRVPAEKFESVFATVKGMGKLVNESISGSDITAQYRDTYTRAENLRIQEKSLQQLMTKANNVDEILRIETELNRVRTEIDMLTGDLKRWDNLVQLSTININLTEVKEEELKKVDVPGIWGQAYNGFIGAINNIILGLEKTVVWIITAIPYLLVLGILGAVGYMIFRRVKKK